MFHMLLFSCLVWVVWSDIPKLIIQTGPNKPVSDFKGFPEQLQKINPSFEYTFYDDAAALDFVAKHFPDSDLLAVYQDPRLKIVMKADIFRLAAISVLGGFYFDMDVYAYRNLDPLLSHRAVFPKEWWRNNGEYEDRHGTLPEDDEDHWQMGNYAFAAEPGHPLVQNALKEAVKRANDLLNTKLSEYLETLEDIDVLKTTGPYMLSEVYHKGRKEGQYGDVYFMMGGNEIPLYPKSRGGPTWHKFGKYGEHAITHTWVRRKLATETELAEILWKANTDKKKDISWARGVIKELKARFGELTISESNENYKAAPKKGCSDNEEGSMSAFGMACPDVALADFCYSIEKGTLARSVCGESCLMCNDTDTASEETTSPPTSTTSTINNLKGPMSFSITFLIVIFEERLLQD